MSFVLAAFIPALLISVAAIATRPLHKDLRMTLVCQGLLLGIGAYTYALVGKADLAGWMTLSLAVIFSGVSGVVLVSAHSRVVGDDFALMTFALQVAGISIIVTADHVTGGVIGMANLPPLPLQKLLGTTAAAFCLFLFLLVSVIAYNHWYNTREISKASVILGRSRELALTHGLPVGTTRVILGASMGCFMGAAGAIYAGYLTFIDPQTFSTPLSVLVLAGVLMLHATGWAIFVLGILVITVLPEFLRIIPDFTSRAVAMREFLAGMAVCAVVLYAIRRGAVR